MLKSNQTKTKNTLTDNKFFVLKIIVIFFCAIPIMSYVFPDTIKGTAIDFLALIPYIVIIIAVIILWQLVNSKFISTTFGKYCEILIMYALCQTAVLCSSGIYSPYKFLFILLIVAYTIEYGTSYGNVLSALIAFSLLLVDIIMYGEPGVNIYLQTDIIMSASFFIMVWVIGYYAAIEKAHIRALMEKSVKDGLTGIYNHRHMHDILAELFAQDREGRSKLSLILINIDNFKIYNDLYGHSKGDEILIRLANIIKESSVQGEYYFRAGGEEFVVIYRDRSKQEAVLYADLLRQKINDYEFEGQDMMPQGNLTVSIGVAERIGKDDTVQGLLERAYQALYYAKCFRKNRVEIYTSIFDKFNDLDFKNDSRMTSVQSLITIINSRDRYTFNHTKRVVFYSEVFADYLNMSKEKKERLVYGAYMHDIGKINVPTEILNASRRLTEEEWAEITKHPSDGADIISQMHGLGDVAKIVAEHHERYDGTGYPKGLKGEEIDYLARVLSLADSFDAMTSTRPYQSKKTYETAFEEIRRCAGKQFDPILTELFIAAISKESNLS